MRTLPDVCKLALPLALSVIVLAPPRAEAQCMLANPSFEIGGQSGMVFGGWNQFGSIGSTAVALHGSKAARVSGPNTGGWDVSGYWQAQTTAAGQRWAVTGFVRVPSSQPLAGQSKAIVNVEWRDSGSGLISYESHDVATAATAPDTFLAFSFTTSPAPAGTATARLVLGVLQAPGDPQRDAYYDRIRFEKQTTPSLDAIQWNDFPTARTIWFAGRAWRVKGTGYYGPGPSMFSSSTGAVYADAEGRMHLTIAPVGSTWYSTEVALTVPLGYGDYVFTTVGRLDTLDPTTVLGLYVWEYGPCYDPAYLWWNPYNETDIEFSRWGVAGAPNAQFVTQPYDWGGNLNRFAMSFSTGEVTSHAFRWRPDRIEYRSWRGGPDDETPASLVHTWTYTGPHIPRPDQPRVHVNLWQFSGAPASPQEVVLSDFQFRPLSGGVLAVGPGDRAPAAALALAGRNPARGGTTLRCTLAQPSRVRLELLDLAGRRVRTLVDGERTAGAHEVAWDGRDDEGRLLAPGVYHARLVIDRGASAAARIVVLR